MFDLRVMDTGLEQATREEWSSQMQDNPESNPIRYEQALDWARKYAHGELADKHCHSYALVRTGEDVACALLELSHGKPIDQLRMLRIHVEPNLDIAGATHQQIEGQIGDLAHLAAFGISSAINLTIDELPAQSLKVLGSTPLTIDFLEGVCPFMQDFDLLEFSVIKQWLLIRRKPAALNSVKIL